MTKPTSHLQDVRHMARTALASGGMPTATSVTVDWATRCQAPVFVNSGGRPYAASDGMFHWNPGQTARLDVDAWVRCRKCPNCLRARAAHWRERAKVEIGLAPRTWFGTLTFGPDARSLALLQCQQKGDQSSNDFDRQSESAQRLALVAVTGREVTLWLKRLRAMTGAPLRYLAVSERHADGFPHFHVLVHEQSKPLRWNDLSSQWRVGFSRFNLVKESERAAAYASKYLTKDAGSRVRASTAYGNQSDLGHSFLTSEKCVENMTPKNIPFDYLLGQIT